MGVTLTPVETAALGGGGRSGVVSKRSRDQVGAGLQQVQGDSVRARPKCEVGR